MDSSQDVSAVKVEANNEQTATHVKPGTIYWSADERRRLKDAHEKGMALRAIVALLPAKTYQAVKAQRHLLVTAGSFKLEERRESIKWKPADIELLLKLHNEGASRYKLCAHFPTRSAQSIKSAVQNHSNQPPTAGIHKSRWSQEEIRCLAESAAQGASALGIANSLGRSQSAVTDKAMKIGVRFISRSIKVSTEEKEQIVQMRTDGASINAIAAALGHTVSTVKHQWLQHRPDTYECRKPRLINVYPSTQLTPDDYQTIRSLRDQAASWSSIESLFPQYQLDSIKQDFWRFTKKRFSSSDVRTIGNLRQEGRTWRNIADTGDYGYRTPTGMRVAYNEALKHE
jgi:DNA-binding NarL/FixJ family response regulator